MLLVNEGHCVAGFWQCGGAAQAGATLRVTTERRKQAEEETMTKAIKAIALAATLGAGAAQAQPVTFAAGQQGSQNYQINSAIANLLATEAGMDVRVQSYGGSGVFLPLLHSGEVDFAAVASPDFSDAYRGAGPFEGLAQESLRIVAVLNPTPIGIFVKADAPIKSVPDLRGQRLTYGMSQQPTLISNIDAILANGGLTPGDIEKVMVPTVRQGADEFLAGRADAVFFAVAGGKIVEVDAAVGGIRFIGMSDDPDAVAAMKEVLPTAYVSTVEGRVGVPEPIKTLTYDYVLIAGAHVSDDVVAEAARTIRENAASLAETAKVFTGYDASNIASDVAGLPFHAGAEAYYREVGLR